MADTGLEGGQRFGDVSFSRLTWKEIESLYSEMRGTDMGVDWICRCATVLTRALELARKRGLLDANPAKDAARPRATRTKPIRSEEHTSELQSLMRISYAVFCLKKKKKTT